MPGWPGDAVALVVSETWPICNKHIAIIFVYIFEWTMVPMSDAVMPPGMAWHPGLKRGHGPATAALPRCALQLGEIAAVGSLVLGGVGLILLCPCIR